MHPFMGRYMKEKTRSVFLKYIHVQKNWCTLQLIEFSFLIRKKNWRQAERKEKIVLQIYFFNDASLYLAYILNSSRQAAIKLVILLGRVFQIFFEIIN